MRKLIVTTFIVASSVCFVGAQDLKSPSGHITATPTNSSLTIYHNGEKAVSIPVLGISTDTVCIPATITSISGPEDVTDCYTMLTGKKMHCHSHANEYVLSCERASMPYRMVLRLSDDGAALRYEIEDDSMVVRSESTAYHIPEGNKRWLMRYNQAYEDFFPCYETGDTKYKDFGYPALVEISDSTFVLFSEADVKRYNSASYLTNEGERDIYRVVWPKNQAKVEGLWQSPWRVMIIGDLPEVVESTMVTDLSPDPAPQPTDWIHPGGVSWVYWAYNHGSNDYQIVKKYIDMAAKLSLPYILIDAEWDEMGNGGNIDDAINYALSVGVKPLIWYNSSTAWVDNGAPGPFYRLNKPEDREREFAEIAAKGVAGVKIDFFDGDEQYTMDYCIDLLECAARHKLLVNFHGATIPRGWQRTYPNLMSVEGVYGAEWYNNKSHLTNKAAAHNCTLPFTRNVVGPMDYTPCTFSDSQHPHITTNAHELALPVVFESALLHWADKPESYYAQPQQVQDFIGQQPTVWDETRLLGGYPGRYVVMARRYGDIWYLGALNGLDESQTIEFDADVFGDKQVIRSFADSGNVDAPWSIIDGGKLPSKLTLQPRGGFVAIIK